MIYIYCFCFIIPQDPSMVFFGRDASQLLRKLDLNKANDGASVKDSPFHALIVLEKNDCPYTILMILASCMANLSKFHIVFSSSTFIRLSKDAFEGHLCQTVNNFVKLFIIIVTKQDLPPTALVS